MWHGHMKHKTPSILTPELGRLTHRVRQGWITTGFPEALWRQRIRLELSVGRGIGEEAKVYTGHISYSTHHGVTCVYGIRSSVLYDGTHGNLS